MSIFQQPNSFLGSLQIPSPPKRNIFISYYHADQLAVNEFIQRFSLNENIFTANMLAADQSFGGDLINSNNPSYVMQKIRERYFGHSTVTIILLGTCSHSRRYIDWEVKSSLQTGGIGGRAPHGLIAINLCKTNSGRWLPPRFEQNSDYAKYYRYPNSGQELRGWIEEAYTARTSKRHLITNAQEMLRNNRQCKHCGRIH